MPLSFDTDRLPPDVRLDLKQRALELAGLNNRACDLAAACEEHRGNNVDPDCTGCAPFIKTCVEINLKNQQFHFARHAAEMAAMGSDVAGEEVVKETWSPRLNDIARHGWLVGVLCGTSYGAGVLIGLLAR